MCKHYKVLISSDRGLVRAVNEDNYVINTTIRQSGNEPQNISINTASEPLLCAVFDGMGGEKGGREAAEISALAAERLYSSLETSGKEATDIIQDYVANCSDQIRQFLSKNKLKHGGSTFAMVYLHDGKAELFNMGDSRIYLYRHGSMFRISRDHTLAQKKFELNIFTREEADASVDSHILTRFLGMDEDSDEFCAEEYSDIKLNHGDRLLICTDGLYDMCTDKEICSILSIPKQPYSVQLVSRAMANGGEDNVTCMVIENV